MKCKKLLGVLCAFVMMFSAGALTLSGANDVFAAENTYYYGTRLVSAGEGSASIASSLSNGVMVTFRKASAASSASYKHSMDMNSFAVDFRFGNANFSELWFKFTDADNSSKWVTVWLRQNGDNLQYKFEDNYGNETDYADSGIAVSSLTSDGGLTLGYRGGAFTLSAASANGATLTSDGIQTLSFYKNIANMSFGVEGVSGEDEDENAVMYITAITNSNGEQTLVTSNSRFTDAERVAPVIVPKADGDDGVVSDSEPDVKTVNAAADSTYVFPYYCLDILGTGWAVTTAVGESGTPGDKVEGKTEHSLGNAGTAYKFEIYAKASDENPLVTLNVTAVNDTKGVTIDNSALLTFLHNSDEIGNDTHDGFAAHIVAPTENNTFEFPHIYRDDFETIFTAQDSLDSYDNVTIQVGYSAPRDKGEFTYVDSYAVRINVEGQWYFRYKVTDSAGNEAESDAFPIRVFDETPPTIKAESTVEITVNEEYTIPSATITDNAAGVDTAYSKWTLYYMNADGSRGEKIENLLEDQEGYEDSILKDGVLTPTELTASDSDGSFILVYEARDRVGNVSDPVEVVIKVVEGTPDYAANPWNDFFVTALIVIACLAGTGIIILIFVKPKERELR